MKKLLYISFIFAFLLAFTSCEKEVIMPENTTARGDLDGGVEDPLNRGGENGDSDEDEDGDGDGGGITDPDEDEDFDEEEDGEGHGITDPDEDEDFDEEEENGR